MIPVLHGEAVSRRQYWGQGRPDITGTLDTAGAAWVAAAAQGAEFHSTTGDQGAEVWVKTAGGWVVTVGDTGWRDVFSALADQLTRTSSSSLNLVLRRVASTVYISATNVTLPAVSSGSKRLTTALPSGFRQASGITIGALGALTGIGDLEGVSPRQYEIHQWSGSGATYAFFQFVFPAANPWPTTIPGTPA